MDPAHHTPIRREESPASLPQLVPNLAGESLRTPATGTELALDPRRTQVRRLLSIADCAKRVYDYELANAIFAYVVSEYGPEVRGKLHRELGPKALSVFGLFPTVREHVGTLYAIEHDGAYLCARSAWLSHSLRAKIVAEGVTVQERYEHRRKHIPITAHAHFRLRDDLAALFDSASAARRFVDVARAGLAFWAMREERGALGALMRRYQP